MGKKQALITNYFPINHPLRTFGHTLEDNAPAHYVRVHAIVAQSNGTYTAQLPGMPHAPLGELQLYEDNNGGQWINNIEVKPQYQRLGLATKLVRAAITEHGHLFASNHPTDIGDDDDTRHLEPDGYALVMMMIQRGIMQPGWYKHPII